MESAYLKTADSAGHRLRITAAFLLAMIPAWLYALPPEFTADYHLEMYHTELARATYSLRHSAGGLTMTQMTRPTGLIALVRKDRIDVRSDIALHDGRLVLDAYSYTHSGVDEDKNTRLVIDRGTAGNGAHVSGSHRGEPVDITTKLDFWDPLSIQVPLMMQADNFGAPHEFSVFMSGEIRTYMFSNTGDDQVEIDDSVYDCVRIVGEEAGRERRMIIWLARRLHYLPVKIQQWKDGEISSTVLLDSASFPADAASKSGDADADP